MVWNKETSAKNGHALLLRGGMRLCGKPKYAMAGKPLVSIVTIVRNGELYLEDAIKSIICQSYENIEYIIIDGNSKDGTLDIIRKYEEKIDYWQSEPDGGISDAFNKGVKFCSGELIGFINADDFLVEGSISKIVGIYNEAREKAKLLVLYGDLYKIEGVNKKKVKPLRRKTFKWQMPIWHPTVFASRDVYERYSYNHEYKIAMDYELLARVYRDGGTFVYIGEAVACMRAGGVSDSMALHGFLEVYRASSRIFQKNVIYNSAMLLYRILLYLLIKLKRANV